ncbi:hypothetical protein [Polaromonas sp.]|uniref:hypothetical protein n=1 Tax=Polaromonas sp. TaxID=1869339 RepID=UPI00326733DF
MNPVSTPARRNATAQDVQHLTDILGRLNLEADGAALILEAMDAALATSFYAALTHSPLSSLAKDMRERVAAFFHPRTVLSPALQAEAERFRADFGNEFSLEQPEPRL